MPSSNMTKLENCSIKYAFDVEIDASPTKVWDLLTHNISLWWPVHYYSSPDTKRFVLEPVVGGRMYEDTGKDTGVLWGNVVVIDPEKHLLINGGLFPDYGGPGNYFLSLKIEPREGGCKIQVDDAQYGCITLESAQSMEGGWKELFGEHLKKAAEA
jgi:uncharacterized protein YndB with AHSA1/START domain